MNVKFTDFLKCTTEFSIIKLRFPIYITFAENDVLSLFSKHNTKFLLSPKNYA